MNSRLHIQYLLTSNRILQNFLLNIHLHKLNRITNTLCVQNIRTKRWFSSFFHRHLFFFLFIIFFFSFLNSLRFSRPTKRNRDWGVRYVNRKLEARLPIERLRRIIPIGTQIRRAYALFRHSGIRYTSPVRISCQIDLEDEIEEKNRD